jgi:hypothetical protein|tara:strand:- start:335 stop:850 length:516 start_codon:yes stop_codon:yes gene_type:complete
VAIEQEVKLSAPVPGMSLTAEPKGRPWRRPYQLSTVDEVAAHYMDLMMNPEFTAGLTEQVEVGFPLAFIADLWTTTSTMEGVHSVDLGALVSPVIIEMMKALLEADGVSYEVGDERDDIKMSKKQMIKMRDDLMNSGDLEKADAMPEVTEPPAKEMPEKTEAPRGLMSRKQ